MTGIGRSGGAGTIVNAMATGFGAAFGIDYKVVATVRTARTWAVHNNGSILRAPDDRLARTAARLVQGRGAKEAWRIDVRSEIPPERGLKSSSAVAIAVIRAALGELDARWSMQRILAAAAEANLQAGVSVTGAFDDAAACLLGGVCVTDNRARKIVRRLRLPPGLVAVVNVPRRRLASGSLRGADFGEVQSFAAEAWDLARRGELRAAMLLNTACYAPFFRHDTTFTRAALRLGAWGAGLSGKGPAEIALARPPIAKKIRRAFPHARDVALRHGGRA